MKKLDITKIRFKRWLRENSDLSFVRGDCEECPIAVFLGSGCDHRVLVGGATVDIDELSFPLPKWAQDFIRKFDHMKGKPPTARNAVELL